MSSGASDLGSASWEAIRGEASPALWLPYINTMIFIIQYLESLSLLERWMEVGWRFPAAGWEAVGAEHRCVAAGELAGAGGGSGLRSEERGQPSPGTALPLLLQERNDISAALTHCVNQ